MQEIVPTIVVITPCSRIDNLKLVQQSINFRFVREWIIVYDASRVAAGKSGIEHPADGKITEFWHSSEGASGNPQRNFALEYLESSPTFPLTYLYFLDDDNLIHPDLYNFVLSSQFMPGKLYSFNQDRNLPSMLKGNCPQVGSIDTAMVLFDWSLVRNLRWEKYSYEADGIYIRTAIERFRDRWVFIDKVLCSYNRIQHH